MYDADAISYLNKTSEHLYLSPVMSQHEHSSRSSLDLRTTPNSHVLVRDMRRDVPARGVKHTKPGEKQ